MSYCWVRRVRGNQCSLLFFFCFNLWFRGLSKDFRLWGRQLYWICEINWMYFNLGLFLVPALINSISTLICRIVIWSSSVGFPDSMGLFLPHKSYELATPNALRAVEKNGNDKCLANVDIYNLAESRNWFIFTNKARIAKCKTDDFFLFGWDYWYLLMLFKRYE